MIKKIISWFKRWAWGDNLYVILDGSDNSVTMSPALVRSIGLKSLREGRVLMFSLPSKSWAFTIDPILDESIHTQLDDIQYNAKHNCIGFENHQVNRILYDYGLDSLMSYKFTIKKGKVASANISYFEILKPLE